MRQIGDLKEAVLFTTSRSEGRSDHTSRAAFKFKIIYTG